jgi:hypothetical protein
VERVALQEVMVRVAVEVAVEEEATHTTGPKPIAMGRQFISIIQVD